MPDTTSPELWTVDQVAEHLDVTRDAARRQLSRWGIQRSSTGQSAAGRITALYDAVQVREAHTTRPGRGARTDLQK